MLAHFKNLITPIAITMGVLFSFQSFSNSNNTPNLRGSGLCFTPNKGQIADHQGNLRPDILYVGDGGGKLLYIRNTGISYVIGKNDEISEEALMNPEKLDGLKAYSHRVDLDFVGCNTNASIHSADKVEGYKNFYLPHCKDGITHVSSFNSLLQKDIYDNIDIAYKGSKAEGLKYDMIVNPGGSVGDIVMKYSGQDELNIEDGNIKLSTSLGEIVEYMPRVYQEIDGKIKDVKANYVLNKEGFVTIETEKYDKSYPLVIDPWVTYIGGSQYDYVYSITSDGSDNIAFVGMTRSNNFPTLGAFQGALSGTTCGVASKMTEAGTMVWSTYYGGTGADYFYGTKADKTTDDVYFTGYTSSSDFPVGAAGGHSVYQNSMPGNSAGILVKLSAAGTRLFGTFFHGTETNKFTRCYDVSLDNGNNLILVGNSNSANGISTAGVFQPALNGASNDFFIAKFNPTGARTWCTYLGGTSSESYCSVDCDAGGNIYVGGYTNSSDFPVSAGAHQGTKSGTSDLCLTKLNSSGQRVWATYYGGSQGEMGSAVCVDNVGDVYLGAGTRSTNGISTPGSYQVAKSTGTSYDAFLVKFNSAGVRQWATYLGGNAGSASDYITGIDVDANNNVVVGGDTYSTNFPVSSCAYQSVFLGTEDQFVATFDPNGTIICSGYIGIGNSSSPNNETMFYGSSITVNDGFIYLCAFTKCNYPVTPGCYQFNCGGNFDGAVAKLCITSCGLTNIIASFDADREIICDQGDPANFTLQNTSCSNANTTYLWTFEGGTPATSTDQSPGNVIYNAAGTYEVKVVIETPCGKDSIIKNAYIKVDQNDPTAAFAASPQPTSMANPTISFTDQSVGAVSWAWNFGQGTSSSQHPTHTYQDSGIYVVQLVVTNEYGCTDTIEQEVVITDADFTFYMPNSFTPNDDGLNDVFIPKLTGNDLNNEGYHLYIFDRWGNMVFETTDPNTGWDGFIKQRGNIGQIDTYVWKVEIKDIFAEEHEYTGHVNLLR